MKDIKYIYVHEYSDKRFCSITDYQRSGLRQTIVIDVEIEPQSVKSVTTARCHSTYLTKHQKTDSSSKNNKCLPIKSARLPSNADSSHLLHIFYNHPVLEETLLFMALKVDLD